MRKLLLALLLLPCIVHAQQYLQADTAATILIGPLVDPTSAAPETGLTISQADVRLSKNGGNMAQKNDSNACTHDELGMYACALDATDTNTEGILTVTINDGGNAMVWAKNYFVLGSAYYDLIDGTTTLLTSEESGLRYKGTVSSVTSQTQIVIDSTGAATNNDAYNEMLFVVEGGTETGAVLINDYTAGSQTVELREALPFTVAMSDTVWIFVEGSQAALDYSIANSVFPANITQLDGTAISCTSGQSCGTD